MMVDVCDIVLVTLLTRGCLIPGSVHVAGS